MKILRLINACTKINDQNWSCNQTKVGILKVLHFGEIAEIFPQIRGHKSQLISKGFFGVSIRLFDPSLLNPEGSNFAGNSVFGESYIVKPYTKRQK